MYDVAIDVETTGLNPWEDRITTIALVDSDYQEWVYDDPDPKGEPTLLAQLEDFMRTTKIDWLVGWNHTEFDLPYIAVRFVLNGIDLAPTLFKTGEIGKYGKPRYTGSWFGAAYHDVAYEYEQVAKDAGVKWSLKPLANSQGIKATAPPVDFSEKSILDLTSAERKLYALSDARQAMGLHHAALVAKPKGQAVKLDGSVTIL